MMTLHAESRPRNTCRPESSSSNEYTIPHSPGVRIVRGFTLLIGTKEVARTTFEVGIKLAIAAHQPALLNADLTKSHGFWWLVSHELFGNRVLNNRVMAVPVVREAILRRNAVFLKRQAW